MPLSMHIMGAEIVCIAAIVVTTAVACTSSYSGESHVQFKPHASCRYHRTPLDFFGARGGPDVGGR